MLKENKNALLIIDVQNDFCTGGALEVPEGDKIIPVINSIASKFFKVVATQDWHPEDHISFAKNHPGKKEYDVIEVNGITQVLWPVHCVKGSYGANLHPNLDESNIDLIIRKGTNKLIDSYSAFFENDKKTKTGLDGYLKSLGIEQVFLCGLATDYCVYYSALDAVALGYETYIIEDAVKGVDVPEGSLEKAIQDMKNKGIKFISSNDI